MSFYFGIDCAAMTPILALNWNKDCVHLNFSVYCRVESRSPKSSLAQLFGIQAPD